MISKGKEIKTDLEDIINRLEDTRNSALDMRASNEMGIQVSDFDRDYGEDMESVEAAIFEFGSFIDEIIQVMGEEIENLRSLVEKLDSSN